MEKFINVLIGSVSVELSGAKTETVLNKLAERGYALRSVRRTGETTLELRIPENDYEAIHNIALYCQCDLQVVRQSARHELREKLRGRKTLLCSFIVLTLLIMMSSLFVWDIEVTGNEKLTNGELLRALEDCGVSIGSFWLSYSNEDIRNKMQLALPEIAYLAVNVSQSRATVIVRERVEVVQPVDNDMPSDIVATKTGVVDSVNVLQGRAYVVEGQIVNEGDLLVTGYMMSSYEGAEDKYVYALGEVTARTWYEMTAVAGVIEYEKQYKAGKNSRWALEIGEKRLNFYISSGNSGVDCDRIAREYELAADGLFTLPLTLVKIEEREYELVAKERSVDEVAAELERSLRAALSAEIGEGEVVESAVTVAVNGDIVMVTLRAQCLEQIGVNTEEPMFTRQYEGEESDDGDQSGD